MNKMIPLGKINKKIRNCLNLCPLPCEYQLHSLINIQASLIFNSLARYSKFYRTFLECFFFFSKAQSTG